MLKNFYAKRFELAVVMLNYLLAPCEQVIISFKLFKTNRSGDIGHIAFIPGADDVIFPGAQL